MKWVSCACQSNGTIATITPVSPPMTKVTSPPITNRVGTLWLGLPIASVAIQLNRSEEHTSELQSLMRISYAVFCLKKKNNTIIPKYMTIDSTTHTNHRDKHD